MGTGTETAVIATEITLAEAFRLPIGSRLEVRLEGGIVVDEVSVVSVTPETKKKLAVLTTRSERYSDTEVKFVFVTGGESDDPPPGWYCLWVKDPMTDRPCFSKCGPAYQLWRIT